MTAFVFPGFKGALLTGDVDFPTVAVRAAFVTAPPTTDLLNMSQLSPVAISPPLVAMDFPQPGMFTSQPATFAAVVATVPITGFVLFIDRGAPALNLLVVYQDDTATGNGFPYSASGGPVTITPDPTSGWFTL